MPIDANCPHCFKSYRLKDEFLGKKVKCANVECRKEFAVTAKPKVDADTVAAQALSDVIAAQPEAAKSIAMSCAICEHKWTVPWEMQTKNVLCPDCKHRQKVPEQKLGEKDWRTAGSTGPSLAKKEVLEDVTSARDTTMVSGETLKKTGVIVEDLEPVPLKVKLARFAGVALLIIAPCLGGYYWCNQRKNRNVDKMLEEVVTASDGSDYKDLPQHRAILRMSAAEYSARLGTPEGLKRSLELYNAALSDLASDPKTRSLDRELLTVELGTSLLCLGGEGEAVIDKKKLNWMPGTDTSTRAQIKVDRMEQDGVMGQMRRVLDTLKRVNADFEVRAWAARKLARELIARKQLIVLQSTLGAGFEESELAEIEGQIGLELLKAGETDEARALAERLAEELRQNPQGNALSAQALWQALEIKGSSITAEPGSRSVGDTSRLAHTAKLLAKKEESAALELASRPGTAEIRLKALAIGAELAENPKPFLEASEKVLSEPATKAVPTFLQARLALAAAKAGEDDKAEAFRKRITDESMRAWLAAAILREKWARQPKDKLNADDAPLPTNLKGNDFYSGQAWARTCLARHNGRLGGNDLAKTYMKDWPGAAAPFGAIGALLGVQDQSLGK